MPLLKFEHMKDIENTRLRIKRTNTRVHTHASESLNIAHIHQKKNSKHLRANGVLTSNRRDKLCEN